MSEPLLKRAGPDDPDEKRLMDLFKLHSDEVRFQVQLNWDRSKSLLTFNLATLALVAGLGKSFAPALVVTVLGFVALCCLASAAVTLTGHDYYRRARKRRTEVEERLQTSLGFVSTPGQSGEGVYGRLYPRITYVVILLQLILAAVALLAAFVYRGGT